MLRLTLLARGYCHLCDLMLDAVHSRADAARLSIDVVDVDADAELEARYGEQVPVLLHGDDVVCWGRYDAAAIDAFVALRMRTTDPQA